jgi:hypothetical protein
VSDTKTWWRESSVWYCMIPFLNLEETLRLPMDGDGRSCSVVVLEDG